MKILILIISIILIISCKIDYTNGYSYKEEFIEADSVESFDSFSINNSSFKIGPIINDTLILN